MIKATWKELESQGLVSVKAHKHTGCKCPRCFKMFYLDEMALDERRGGLLCYSCYWVLQEYFYPFKKEPKRIKFQIQKWFFGIWKKWIYRRNG